jgi:transcriptional regulator with XRE-family HTH domain
MGQYELAEAAQINASVISRMERELQADFKLSVVVAIAQALGVHVDELLISHQKTEEIKQNFVPELETTLIELRKQPATIQRQAAGVIKGLISTIQE